VGFAVLVAGVVRVGGDHHRDAGLLGELNLGGVELLLVLPLVLVGLKLEEIVALTEGVVVPTSLMRL
jgi:hypothetical protein